MAETFFKCNIPFRIIADSSFVKMIRGLRPSINLPTRQAIVGPLLDQCYLDEIAKNKENVKSSLGSIHIDGWKNCPANAKYVVVLLEVGGQYILLRAVDTTVTGEKAVVLAAIAGDCQKLALEIYGVRVFYHLGQCWKYDKHGTDCGAGGQQRPGGQ